MTIWDGQADTEDGVDAECEKEELPELSLAQLAALLPLLDQVDREGFSPSLADQASRQFYPQVPTILLCFYTNSLLRSRIAP